LPIFHEWFHLEAGEFEPIDIDSIVQGSPALDVQLGVGSHDTVIPLVREIDARGFFDWRTWSMKAHLSPGRWIVRVVDAHDDPLRCGAGDCTYEIQVR
jgi:hypothetical protein